MEYRSPVRDEVLRQHLQQCTHAEDLERALAEFDDGNAAGGHETLQPLIANSDPCAILLAAMFSTESESEQEFIERHLAQLRKAAILGNSVAMYALGVYLDQGVLLDLDKLGACAWFKRGAELGMPQAQFVYGVMLYYGTGGAPLNVEEGMSMVQAAASAGVDEATDFLEFLNSRGK